MSYRVDIPTLSTNEVYTLTFEYEGTETIQLIVGDLTLETTDRRVVFTTASPVNYIESNVNLTNLNMYEGYYESDDFGGEYTQESYIEGKSLINYKRRVDYGTLINNANIQETFTDDGYINYKQLATGATGGGFRGNGFAKNIDQSKNYTIILRVRKNTFPVDVFVPFTLCHKDCGVKFDETVKGDYWGISYNISGRQTGVWKAVVIGSRYNVSASDRYWGSIHSFFVDENSEVTDLTQRTDIVGCEIEYAIEVLQGDYFDIDTGIDGHFTGIGCVKSPKILSETKHRNIMLNTKPFATTNLITVSDDNTYIYLAEAARYSGLNFKFTQEYLAQHGISNGDKLCIELDGRLIEGTGTQAAKTSTRIGIDACTWSDGSSGLNTVYKNLPENGHYCDYITINYNAGAIGISFLNNPDWTGTNKIYEIQNFRVYKIEDISEVGTYDCCKLTTPDDLELYKVNDTIYDKLDLTTGTLYKNTGTYVLDETFVDRTSNWTVSVDNTTGNVTFTSRQHSYLRDEHNFPYSLYNNAIVSNADPANNIVNNSNIEITRPRLYFDIYYNNNYTVIIMPASYNVTTLEELRAWLQNNPMIFNYKLGTPYTEQLSLNPLKSYRNGSIQTSSQQLAPTLTTTLPISNKFTTTNLTSGQTYNIYFDGTATKLDAGSTIITDPVSPCEVECGGTTLTIEGTDIQNVRVLETTNKNEVGSVNGTTDVELKKMKTCKYENILDDIKYSTTVSNGAVININYDDFCIEFMGNHGWAAEFADTGLKYPTGCSLVHVEFDIDMDKPNLRMAINFNEGIHNNYPQHRHVTLNNDTATIAQGNNDNIYTSIITKGHFSRLMYANGDRPIIINLYTGSYITGNLATGNSTEGSIDDYETIGSNYGRITNLRMRIIENFSSNYTTVTSVLRDSSYNIIWQDMDMTMPTTTSKLEQPIKLRSLGTTYDSYNPVTGELTKRIGVSETDGSYSVLSSPIVSQVMKVETLTNVFPYLTNVVGDTAKIIVGNATYDEDNWVYFHDKKGSYQSINYLDMSNFKPNTDYTWFVEVKNNTLDGVLSLSMEGSTSVFDSTNIPVGFNGLLILKKKTKADFTSLQRSFIIQKWYTTGGTIDFRITIVEGDYTRTTVPHFIGTQDVVFPINQPETPQLYTNGQVKVYSESDVYPTTILNGQSTNNYEVNELNKSNNYTIRYDGTCESINLNGKSNEQGTNKIVKTSTNGSGNLTFVNDSGDINNVLLVQNDVREQEIEHFNGLQTVEVSRILIENQRNMSSQHYIFENGSHYDYQRILPHYIKVEPNETLYANIGQNWMDWCTIYQYDEDKNRLSDIKVFGGYGTTQFKDSDGLYKNIITLSNNTRYIRIVLHNAFTSTFTLSRGDFLPPSALAYNQYQGQYIDLPQPVQLNSLPDGTHDTYNPITGEYTQNVGYFVLDDTFASSWLVSTLNGHHYAQRQVSTQEPNYLTLTRDYGFPSNLYDYQAGTKAIANIPIAYSMLNTGDKYPTPSLFGDTWFGNYHLRIALPFMVTEKDQWNYSHTQVNDWLRENPIHIAYKRTEPITTQLTPINIPTFEGGIVQLITTDGKVFPMVEYSMPTNNRYDTSTWETGAVYTQRNMTEAYFNESTTPMVPTETMTLTTDHISSGSIILNDNGNRLIVLKGNYTGRDIPYFTGMRSVEAIEVETTPSPDQPLFGKGGRK